MHRLSFALCSIALSLVPLAAQETPAVRVERPGGGERLELRLPEAIAGRDVTLHLGHQGDRFRQAWATVDGVEAIVDVVDASGLRLVDGHLHGEVTAWIPSPEERRPLHWRAQIDARLVEGAFDGEWSASWSVLSGALRYRTDELRVAPEEVSFFHYGQELEGELTARWRRPAGPEQARFTLWTAHALKGDASWKRKCIVELEVVDGVATAVSLRPRHDHAGWRASVGAHDLAFDGTTLGGTLTAKVDGAGGLTGGAYELALEAELSHNALLGSVTTRLPSGGYEETCRLSGIGDGGEAAAGDGILECELPAGIEGGRDLRVHVPADGTEGVGFVPRYAEHWPVERRAAAGGGELLVHFPADSWMTAIEGAVDVRYELALGEGGQGRYRCRFGQRSEAAGSLAGRLVPRAELLQRDAIRDGYDWPVWNGPLGNFSARPCDHELVDRLQDARLVWIGEHTPPARCQTTRYGEGNVERFLSRGGPTGGGCSAVLAEGRVFLYYFRPVPGHEDEDFIAEQTAKGNHVIPAMWSRRAEGVVLCLDAATGATHWKAVVPGGRYFGSHGTGRAKGAYTSNLAVADGRVFAHTTGGLSCAFATADGELLWTSPHGGGALRTVVGETLVASGDDVVGLDVATGRRLWVVEDAGSRSAMPLRWPHEGRELLLCGNAAGAIRCLDPADGRTLWTVEGLGDNSTSMALAGDRLLCVVGGGDGKGPLGCYRLASAGAEALWRLPEETYVHRGKKAPPCASARAVYLRRKKPDALLVVDLASGEVTDALADRFGSSGYVQHMADRVAVDVDASHSRTTLKWYDVAEPGAAHPGGEAWPSDHRTTGSYYPILISHPMADGRLFIRGQRGIVCYDLRRPPGP